MKPNKGFITVFMMVLISISLSTFSRAAFDTFSDVPNDSPFHESIFYLAERGIVCGEGNGRYVPDAPVTVRQWATMLCRALGNDDPLNYDDDCIRQGYSDGWLEMTAITAPDSDFCRYAIYKSSFAAFGVDLYSLQLYPNEGKLSQQSEVLRAAADFGLCEETCDGTEIITRGEAAELLYALLTKTFAVVPPPMLDISLMSKDEVFELSSTSSSHISARRQNISCLRSSISGIFSITMYAFLQASSNVET